MFGKFLYANELLRTAYPQSSENDNANEIIFKLVRGDEVNARTVSDLIQIFWTKKMSEKYWVAVFEALIVMRFPHADNILKWIREKLMARNPYEARIPVPTPIIVGILRGALWCEANLSNKNEDFDRELPFELGNLLRSQAEFHQENDPSGKWIVNQFSEALSIYLDVEHQQYRDRASALLKPLRNVCLRRTVQNKLLHELISRLMDNMGQTARINLMWEWHRQIHHMDEAERQSA